MGNLSTMQPVPTQTDLDKMDSLYRNGGKERLMEPHIVYAAPVCPFPECGERLQAIDFRLEAHGKAVHDPLVLAWWNDTGFAGRCPRCGRWIHFTIRGKRSITEDEANQLPQLPINWHTLAIIL
ncbi:MAG TPA: hypothetical protein VGY77_11635 [Gemmataceae bacterium]|jgi:hypothetical protein|nr:hypothetical protein [Gemmataceae bacterium]